VIFILKMISLFLIIVKNCSTADFNLTRLLIISVSLYLSLLELGLLLSFCEGGIILWCASLVS
jgi:hypothetical protein